MRFKNPKVEYKGKLEDYPLENYPDYVPGKPPQTEMIAEIDYLDEVEREWGKKWGGCQGIGKLREVALIKPHEQETNPLWQKDPKFFLLRKAALDLGKLEKGLNDYANLLESEGVKVHWMDIENTWGVYGPMRKMFMGAAVFVLKGGAVLSRYGQNSFIRGRNFNFQKFLTKINCPILHTVHGKGICEPGAWVPILEDVIVGCKGSAGNDDGIDQVTQVMNRNGVKEFIASHTTGILDSFEAGGEFHTDMHIAAVDVGVVLLYPGYTDYQVIKWLKNRNFKILEIPNDEHHLYCPGNLVILEPGKVIMTAQAKETIKRVKAAGVKVIELDTSYLMAGTNGIRCTTMFLVRDEGPGLETLKKI